MTVHHFDCPRVRAPMVIRDTSLQFTWDDQTAEVNGRDADIVLALAEGPVIPFGPEPMG